MTVLRLSRREPALDEAPGIRLLETLHPASETYFVEPLDERVPVYQKPFRLTREVLPDASPLAAAALGPRTSLALSTRLEYQACDHTICYNAGSVPFSRTFAIGAVYRERVGGR